MNLQTIKKVLYAMILIALILYLVSLGEAVWASLLRQWNVALFVALIAPFSLGIQVKTFCICLPPLDARPSTSRLMEIWSVATITSLLAPLFAGLAVRATLLRQSGIPLSITALATTRQIYLNTEYALITTAALVAFGLTPFSEIWGLWFFLGMILLVFVFKKLTATSSEKTRNIVQAVLYRPWGIKNRLFFLGQIAIMSVNYFFAFRLAGADLSVTTSILMATVTILSTLIMIVPNGLGILDAFWVFVATQHGLTTGESVALALNMRVSYLIGTMVFLVAIHILKHEKNPLQ